MGKFAPCALTPAHEKAWETTRAALVWHSPAFSHIFYTMLNNAGSKHIAMFTEDESIPIAATDGINMILRPSTFFALPLNQRVFVCAHEILHCVFNHINIAYGFAKRGKVSYPDGSELPYSHEIMNIAEDLVINDILIESKVGEFVPGGCHDQSLGTAKDAAIDVYKKVYEDMKSRGKIKEVGVRFDGHLDPGASKGQDPGQTAQDRNESKWGTEIAAAAASARAQGKLPAGLERIFNDILNPRVDWREHIAALFARKVGSSAYDYRRADRRLIVRDLYAPGRSGFGAGTVVVGVDTSGSIGPKILDSFFAEMSGILEDLRPKRLIVMWCDAQVARVDELNDPGDLGTVRHKGVPGGGGTTFKPVFAEIESMGLDPDALVYLTDGLGSFPEKAPRYPVIWGSIYEQSKYPFGDVVNIPAEG